MLPIINDILSGVGSVAKGLLSKDEDKSVVDGVTEKAKAELEKAFIEAQSLSVRTESQGESWIQRNWRPITMLSFNALLLFKIMIYPILRMKYQLPMMEFPPELWSLLTIGIGGYGTFRTAEKSLLPALGVLIEKLKK